jgi:hypothetical protein
LLADGETWIAGCCDGGMDFVTAVDRVRHDFDEMPGLELTVPQAVRLWHMGVDDCRYVLDALVDAGFLRWTPRWTIVRGGHDVRAGVEHISVRNAPGRNKSVRL